MLGLQPGGAGKATASGLGTWLPHRQSLLAPLTNSPLGGQSGVEFILVEGGESLLFAVSYILDY